MPYPNEHACRIREPGDFQANSFRRLARTADGKPINLIVGRLKGESTTTLQAFRYPKSSWTAAAARTHCTDHKGKSFEPAAANSRRKVPDLTVYGGAIKRGFELIATGAIDWTERWEEPETLIGESDDWLGRCGDDIFTLPIVENRDGRPKLIVGALLAARRAAAGDGNPALFEAVETLLAGLLPVYSDKSCPFSDGREERCYSSSAIERSDDKTKRTLIGYAAVFDSPSEPLGFGGWVERIAQGAFSKTIENGDDVIANVNHDGGLQTLARTKSKTLRLSEDPHGLRAEIDLPDTGAGRDVWELVTRGDITKMSFAFSPVLQEWNDENKTRTLKEVKLFDVSVVNFPAYEATHIGTRDRLRKMNDDRVRWSNWSAEGKALRTTLDENYRNRFRAAICIRPRDGINSD